MADKALLLGINEYHSVNHLRGCVNDVEAMHELLTVTFGFKAENIRKLTNDSVVKAAVVDQMKWLFEKVKPGDRVLLHFSGHGSSVPDQADDDGKVDEIVCLWDMAFDDDKSYFRDKELRDWTRRLPKGAQLVVVLDNCHSGSGTRMLAAPAGGPAGRFIVDATDRRIDEQQRGMRAVEPEGAEIVLARFVQPPLHIEREINKRTSRLGFAQSVVQKELKQQSAMNHLLMAACRKEQTAADAYIEGKFRGAFTFHLSRVIQESGDKIDRKDLDQRLAERMTKGGFAQVPQFEAPVLSGPLFARNEAASSPPGSAPTTVPTAPENPIKSDPLNQTPPKSTDVFAQIISHLDEVRRLLAMASPGLPSARRATGPTRLVMVHGICKHVERYSDPWWTALDPFAPSCRPGRLAHERMEVLWSDLVNPRGLEMEARSVEVKLVSDEMREAIRDRSAVMESQLPDAGARGLFDWPDRGCLDDFARYMVDNSIRASVIDRFRQVVKPLLETGCDINIISHSWGTVVAYEALRIMDAELPATPGRVRNLFSVGAALSIMPVRRFVLTKQMDGRRPKLVDAWLNLNARGDLVGGPLHPHYSVDTEFLGLEPVGCEQILRVPSPVCAHSSYFNVQNLPVNRDIFGRLIG